MSSGVLIGTSSTVLWNTYGQCENYGSLTGHRGAILDLQWSRDSKVIFSASADMTLASWDLESGQRLRRHVGHEEIINCLDISKRGQELLVSGSDDGCIGIWDPRQKDAVEYLETELPITAVALSEAGNEIYSGGIDNMIHVWDLRKKAIVYSMAGHTDTVTSLQISPDSQTLLSNSHDSTVRTWDIRPFAPTNRHIKTYDGAPIGLEKNLIRASWDPKGEKIAAGSGDRSVVVWDAKTGKLLYKLPGHKGTVNDVRFSPNDEPISESSTYVLRPECTFANRTSLQLSLVPPTAPFYSVSWGNSRSFPLYIWQILGLSDTRHFQEAARYSWAI